jgi:transcriptional regulator with PAS, ATPase and Fis domain
VSRIIKVKNLQRENTILRKKLTRQYSVHDVISKNAKMHEIMDLAREIASMPSTVLIQGESGTGKELIARAIHNSGDRASKPFVAVSCAALAETLLESELFGHERGAFTGATGQKQGKFEMAHGGTIFLDEIGDISPKLQVDLLRVLQDRAFYRVGGSQEVRVDVRVVAATHVNLQQAVAEGRFRDDLFYRLNVIEIRIPPLRDRREDIPLLAAHFLERISHELGRDVSEIGECALRVLMDYHWPGNVRELENAVERAVVTCRGRELLAEHFGFLAGPAAATQPWNVPSGATLQDMEKVVIMATIERTGGNIKESASILGIDRSTLYEKIKKYGIPR